MAFSDSVFSERGEVIAIGRFLCELLPVNNLHRWAALKLYYFWGN